MPLSRRSFLVTGSLAAGALATVKPFAAKAAAPEDLQDWSVVRQQFDLDPNYAHLGLFYLTSHPRPVRAAIESYRKQLDANPFLTVERGMFEDNIPLRVTTAIGNYTGANAQDIALTQKTTTGLGADAFSAGLHKWISAPRGTGFVWAKPEVWATMRPLIPSFSTFELFNAWEEGHPPTTTPKAAWFTPGGFHSFEHQWAVPAA